MEAKIDDRLQARLSGTAPLDAYVQIRPSVGRGAVVEGEALARRIIQRIEKLTHSKVKYHYLDLLGSIHVCARPRFLRNLLMQPEVISAAPAPDLGKSALIKPSHARKVPQTSINTPLRKRSAPR